MLEVKTKKTFSKSIAFKKTGEVISVEITIENPSPATTDGTVLIFAKNLLNQLEEFH